MEEYPEVEQLPYFFGFDNLKRVPFETILPDVPSEAKDLLDKMITLNPKRRITIKEVQEHVFLGMAEATGLSEKLLEGLKGLDEVKKLV